MNKLQSLRIKSKAAELSRKIELLYKTHVKLGTMPDSFWDAFEKLDDSFSLKMSKTESDMEMSAICRATEAEFIRLLKA
jgi:hypothetical protein